MLLGYDDDTTCSCSVLSWPVEVSVSEEAEGLPVVVSDSKEVVGEVEETGSVVVELSTA